MEEIKNEVTYIADGTEMTLTMDEIRHNLVGGTGSAEITNEEVIKFMRLCQYRGLNPWVNDAYCVKYGRNTAQFVVGKDAFLKRAEANKAFDGLEAGIIVQTADNKVEQRVGACGCPGEKIIGGWARVWRKDHDHPTEVSVAFNEYAARKSDGSLNSMWMAKPATMIRKVALVQALRESFPSDLGGMYEESEQNVQGDNGSFTRETPHDNLVDEPLGQMREVKSKVVDTANEVAETVEPEELPFA